VAPSWALPIIGNTYSLRKKCHATRSIEWERLQSVRRLQSIRRLQSVRRLQSIRRLQSVRRLQSITIHQINTSRGCMSQVYVLTIPTSIRTSALRTGALVLFLIFLIHRPPTVKVMGIARLVALGDILVHCFTITTLGVVALDIPIFVDFT
jgi:hypothetical protein